MAFAIILLSCSAEDGEPGPQGPQGEQGEVGAQGEQGPQGPEGNSNVVSSEWFGIETWERDTPLIKLQTILELTDSQLESGVILIYRRQQTSSTGGVTIRMLPIIFTNSRLGYSVETWWFTTDNSLKIVIEAEGRDVAPDTYLPPETQFRYIIIEPPSTSDKDTMVNFSKMSYEEVIGYLGLNP